MALVTTVSMKMVAALSKTIGAIPTSLTPQVQVAGKLTSGILLDQADKVYYARPTIGGSATLTLDVASGGGLEDVYGDAFAIAKLKAIIIKADLVLCPNVINLQRPASNGVPLFLAVSDGIPIRPGGALCWFAPDLAGVAVTAATADLIDIVNTAAGNVQPEILIVGASA